MGVITESIFIRAPVEKVFGYVVDPIHGPKYHPNVVDQSNITSHAGEVGQKWDWKVSVIGVTLHGHSEVLEMIPNKRWVMNITGDATSKRIYTFEPVNEGTRLTVEVAETIVHGPLAKLAQSVADGIHQINMHQALENLKKILESS